jgi:hypothetical protein
MLQTYTLLQAVENRQTTTSMSIETVLRTQRGKERAEDSNGYNYHINRTNEKVKYWRCAQNGCSLRPGSRICTLQLKGENLLGHDHSTNLMKQKA